MSEHYYEDLTAFALSEEERKELFRAQTECGFCWSTREGWPVGVIMGFVWREGRFWLTATNERKRIRAVARDPRCSVIITSVGSKLGGARTVTAKGRCTIRDDRETKDWFYPALAERLFPEPSPARDAFCKNLDIPSRVVLEVVPEKYITCDAAKMMADSLSHLLPGS